ncbi:MAG: ribosome small subunit-dependent GTPase A [Rhodobacter sp.]|nr:ribosome small subunit-dependent GTPase A [Rhodobacter sp.]
MIPSDLAALGLSARFRDQITPQDCLLRPARIAAVHRDRVDALGEDGPLSLTLPPGLMTGAVAVGDWALTDGKVLHRLLDRQSLLTRRAAGKGVDRQLIAANLDRLAIVTSCNGEFNLARLDRYLALAHAGGIAPVIILTRADMTDPAPYLAGAGQAARGAPVLALHSRDPAAAAALAQWCGPGQTLGLVGSSGVGKSTLAGSLTGTQQQTGPIREADARGRHTTSARFLIRTLSGGWLIDTPGMRELGLAGTTAAIGASFDDLDALALTCRFTNCGHDSEPGCAVRAAVRAGSVETDRLQRWRKLIAEDRHTTAKRDKTRSRSFGKAGKATPPGMGRRR